jgi:hypothetical protein
MAFKSASMRAVPPALRGVKGPLFAVLWCVAVGAGTARLLAYEFRAGERAPSPSQWPAEAVSRPPHGAPRLLVFLHPQCPCSKATVGEMTSIMERAARPVDCTAVFFAPPDRPAWRNSALVVAADAVPGIDVAFDVDGAERRRFGARTSGHAVLYSADGELLFAGGLTGSRGHAGANPGAEALAARIARPVADRADAAPVFGCPLEGATCAGPPCEEHRR